MLSNFKWFGTFFELYHPNEDVDAMNDITDIDGGEEKEEEVEEEKEEEVKEEEDEEEKEEDDKDKEEKEEEDEDEDEDVKLTTTVTDIKAKFPEFFKEFPDVKAAMFREQRYMETVGTLQQAEEASNKAVILDQINDDLVIKGNPIPMLDTLSGSKETFTKVMNQILPYLQGKDKDLYLEVASVPIKQLLRAAWREGKGNSSNLGKAAMYIHDFFFNGDRNIESQLKNESLPKKEEKSDSEKKLEERLSLIEQKEYTSFKNSVDNTYLNRMTKYIDETLDKDERLTDYMKEKISEDVLREVFTQLEGDERFKKQRDAIWNGARQSGWNNDFKSRLLSTVLARAKSLVPEARKKAVAKALGKKPSSTNKVNKDKTDERVKRFSSTNNGHKTKQLNKPLTDMDILRES